MGICRIEAIISSKMVDELLDELNGKSFAGATISNVIGCGSQKGHYEYEAANTRGVEIRMLPKQSVVLYVEDSGLDAMLERIKKVLYTGHIGDGKIFVSEVSRVIKVRTGEEGVAALQ